jgi:hypothetical protein|nr:hypothetical protein [uncultured Psychroserpens sp.]
MKVSIYLVLVLLLTGCSSTRINDSWVNKDYVDYQPKKVLIVGLTDNVIARRLFEEQLKTEFSKRGVDAIESYTVFKPTFTNLKQTEENIQKEVERISKDGFDAILISAVKGVEEKTSYSGDTYMRNYHWRRFGRYYYLVQDVHLIEGYYSKYKIYHVEASLYNLKENNDKSLVWVTSYDIVDPKQINTTVSDYVKAIINSLENKRLINSN